MMSLAFLQVHKRHVFLCQSFFELLLCRSGNHQLHAERFDGLGESCVFVAFLRCIDRYHRLREK